MENKNNISKEDFLKLFHSTEPNNLEHLDDFEKDLRIHATIEDEVLIPLAKLLEEEFNSKS